MSKWDVAVVGGNLYEVVQNETVFTASRVTGILFMGRDPIARCVSLQDAIREIERHSGKEVNHIKEQR